MILNGKFLKTICRFNLICHTGKSVIVFFLPPGHSVQKQGEEEQLCSLLLHTANHVRGTFTCKRGMMEIFLWFLSCAYFFWSLGNLDIVNQPMPTVNQDKGCASINRESNIPLFIDLF